MNSIEDSSPSRPGCPGSTESKIRRYDRVLGPEETDQVVVEEPLEIRVDGAPFATLLRTPGQDTNLALGFLYAEGVIDCRSDIGALSLCGRDALAEPDGGSDVPVDDSLANIVDLLPGRAYQFQAAGFAANAALLRRWPSLRLLPRNPELPPIPGWTRG